MLIEELMSGHGQAFLMARVDGMTYAEIAQVMKVSESRVKQHLVGASSVIATSAYINLRPRCMPESTDSDTISRASKPLSGRFAYLADQISNNNNAC